MQCVHALAALPFLFPDRHMPWTHMLWQMVLMACMVQAERFAEYEFGGLEKVLETDLKSFGKGFSVFEQVCLQCLHKSLSGYACNVFISL